MLRGLNRTSLCLQHSPPLVAAFSHSAVAKAATYATSKTQHLRDSSPAHPTFLSVLDRL